MINKKYYKNLKFLLVIALILILLFLIYPFLMGKRTCDLDKDCPFGYICSLDGKCIKGFECVTDLDCPLGESCIHGECLFMGPCKVDADCPEGQVCVLNKCFPFSICVDNIDCPSGTYCQRNQCVPLLDGICLTNSAYDPDCPLYCPPMPSGGHAFCCLDVGKTKVISCNPTQEQAMVSIGESDPVLMKNAIHTISFTTGLLAEKHNIWIEQMKVTKAATTEAEEHFQIAWGLCEDPGEALGNDMGCIGLDHGYTNVGGKTIGFWASKIIDFDELELGTYYVYARICMQDVSLLYPPVCKEMTTTLIISRSRIEFIIGSELG